MKTTKQKHFHLESIKNLIRSNSFCHPHEDHSQVCILTYVWRSDLMVCTIQTFKLFLYLHHYNSKLQLYGSKSDGVQKEL